MHGSDDTLAEPVTGSGAGTGSRAVAQGRAVAAGWAALPLLAAGLALTLLASDVAAQDTGMSSGGQQSWESLGPLETEEYIPLARLGYTPVMEGAATLPAGAVKASLRLAYGNHFQLDSTATHELVMDLERLTTAVDLRWGLTDAVEVGGQLTFETTGGGFLDSFIEVFHGTLQLNNPTRENYPQDAYGQRLVDGSGRTLVDIRPRAFTLEDVRLQARWGILGRDHRGPALTLRGTLRVPTARNTVGDEAPELGASVLARVGIGRVHLHGMVGGATVAGAPDVPRRRGAQFFGVGAVEVGLSSSVSAVVQSGAGTSRLRNFDGLEVDGPHLHIVAGLRGRHGRWGWQAGFEEDLPGAGSSADFTLVLGVSRRH